MLDDARINISDRVATLDPSNPQAKAQHSKTDNRESQNLNPSVLGRTGKRKKTKEEYKNEQIPSDTRDQVKTARLKSKRIQDLNSRK